MADVVLNTLRIIPEGYDRGESVRSLGDLHSFHKSELAQWAQRSATTRGGVGGRFRHARLDRWAFSATTCSRAGWRSSPGVGRLTVPQVLFAQCGRIQTRVPPTVGLHALNHDHQALPTTPDRDPARLPLAVPTGETTQARHRTQEFVDRPDPRRRR